MENLNQYVETYTKDPFEKENSMMLSRFVSLCISNLVEDDTFLELGIGHGITLSELVKKIKNVTVLEGSSKLISQYQNMYDNVDIVEVYFEKYNTSKKFNNIGMGFVLEHVDDPIQILKQYKPFLTDKGSIFIGVPSASSLHRSLALNAGMIDDIRVLSDADIKFGHKRFFTYDDWCNVIKSAGLRVKNAHGLYLKPFTTDQIASLNLDSKIIEGLSDIALLYPEIANTLYFEVGKP